MLWGQVRKKQEKAEKTLLVLRGKDAVDSCRLLVRSVDPICERPNNKRNLLAPRELITSSNMHTSTEKKEKKTDTPSH